jgi:hypothetical protein
MIPKLGERSAGDKQESSELFPPEVTETFGDISRDTASAVSKLIAKSAIV